MTFSFLYLAVRALFALVARSRRGARAAARPREPRVGLPPDLRRTRQGRGTGGEIRRRDRMGELIHEYYQAAA